MSDEVFFESYGQLISASYPQFLKRLGLKRVAVKAEGATITDSAGKTYIDCIAGYGLFNLGHNHPAVIQALQNQLERREPFTKPFISDIQVRLAEKLAEITPASVSCSFLCNSGSEAIDSAIKLARLCTGKSEIISALNSFHGYTFGALSASGLPHFTRTFEPLVPGVEHVPFGDIEALKNAISPDTGAILLEPVQHEAGISIPPAKYFQQVRRICDERDILFILDEIKTGCGKTGRMFAFERFGVAPDILVLGKSLGGGLMPVGALVADKKLWRKFGLSFPMSASSFAGNVFACRAAFTTLEILQRESIVEEVEEKGGLLLTQLQHCVDNYSDILKAVKGLGLLLGIETRNSKVTMGLAREMVHQGILTAPAFGNSSVLMLEPPLVISVEQIRKVIEAFETACNALS